jgi:hypothetical protein
LISDGETGDSFYHPDKTTAKWLIRSSFELIGCNVVSSGNAFVAGNTWRKKPQMSSGLASRFASKPSASTRVANLICNRFLRRARARHLFKVFSPRLGGAGV